MSELPRELVDEIVASERLLDENDVAGAQQRLFELRARSAPYPDLVGRCLLRIGECDLRLGSPGDANDSFGMASVYYGSGGIVPTRSGGEARAGYAMAMAGVGASRFGWQRYTHAVNDLLGALTLCDEGSPDFHRVLAWVVRLLVAAVPDLSGSPIACWYWGSLATLVSGKFSEDPRYPRFDVMPRAATGATVPGWCQPHKLRIVLPTGVPLVLASHGSVEAQDAVADALGARVRIPPLRDPHRLLLCFAVFGAVDIGNFDLAKGILRCFRVDRSWSEPAWRPAFLRLVALMRDNTEPDQVADAVCELAGFQHAVWGDSSSDE